MGDRRMSWLWLVGSATCVAGMLAGCGVSGPKQLDPATFLAPPPAPPSSPDLRTDARRSPSDDQGGALSYAKSAPDPADSGGLLTVPNLKGEPAHEVTGVSDTVRENVKTPAEVAQQRVVASGSSGTTVAPPATAPTPGEYMTLGAVVVTVNGNPIYANKLLSDIAPVLRVKARELEAADFQHVVEDEVDKQAKVLVRTELEFAAAQRNLDEHDRKLADQLTMHWREEQITAAGGSVEQARSRAKADGRDFDDLVQEQYRVEMRRIYFQKKEFPKVQISAQDMRQYYADHQDQFSTRSEAKFDLIKITFDASGGREKALARITAIRDRIQRGEDFSVIAGVENDADDLRNSKGDAGFGDWIERGAFANQQVEDAVWQVQPGQMTPIIEGPNAFFLAKMIQRKDGQSRSFADADVQALIRRALEAEQFEALRDKVLNDLESQAIVSPNPPDYQPVIEMAMQMYPIWRK